MVKDKDNRPVWPFPAECPPKPWTPEQQRKWAEEQLKRLPDAPM